MRSLGDVLVALSQSPELALLAKVTLVAAVGLAVVRLSRHARASIRHLALATALASMIALPLAGGLAPEIVVPVAVERAAAISPSAVAAPTATSPSPAAAHEAGTTSAPSWSVADILRIAWALGTVVFLVPLGVVLWRLRHLRRTGLPWRDAHAALQSLAADAGVNRPVDLLLHEEVAAPFTFGVRHPAIVLPRDARDWDPDDLRRALVHELQHVARGDWPVQVMARVACAVYWFHPLAWMALRQLGLEAERACDDAVIAKEENVEYAEQLVSLAERLSAAHAQQTLGMAHRSDLSARVRSMLDPGQRRGPVGLRASAVTLVAAAALVLAVAPVRAVPAPAPSGPGDAALAIDAANTDQSRLQRALDRELYEAAEAGDAVGIRDLLNAGANVNAAIEGDGSPLIAAARNGRLDILRLLLDLGADPNLGVEGDGSALIAAAAAGEAQAAQLLLDRGAQVDLVVQGDENALIQASAAGHLPIVQLLVARGADVNARVLAATWRGGEEWRTPLSVARRGGHDAVARFLISAGARQ